MKKFIMGACAVLAVMASACSKGADKEDGFVADKALSDSVSAYVGKSTGGYVLADFQRYAVDATASKKDILKGVQLVLANADDEALMMGIQLGGQIANQIKRIEGTGVKVDRKLFMREFSEAFLSDTLDMVKVQEASEVVQNLMTKVQDQRSDYEAKAAAEAAEAAGTNLFFEELQQNDADVVAAPSGLYYKIIEPGEDTKVTDDNMVVVNYKGSLTDGTVFDQSAEGQPAEFSPKSVIPGFSEGLKLLGKGGKAVLYIPGELAYGANGVPQAGIGPNATLVFEIEVVDVK